MATHQQGRHVWAEPDDSWKRNPWPRNRDFWVTLPQVPPHGRRPLSSCRSSRRLVFVATPRIVALACSQSTPALPESYFATHFNRMGGSVTSARNTLNINTGDPRYNRVNTTM